MQFSARPSGVPGSTDATLMRFFGSGPLDEVPSRFCVPVVHGHLAAPMQVSRLRILQTYKDGVCLA